MAFRSDLPAFYLPRRVEAGELLELPAEELQHLRALRLRTGDRLLLLDGKGGRTVALLEGVTKASAAVRAESIVFDEAERGAYIALAIGILSDKSRFEWLVEKSVELGAGAIIPLESERSEGYFNRSRAERIALAALKQSQRSWLPAIEDPVGLEKLLEGSAGFDRIIFCHEGAPERDSLFRTVTSGDPPQRILLAVGPEGGFSPGEVEIASNKAMVVSLGEARLRAETAAIAALALVAAWTGEHDPGR